MPPKMEAAALDIEQRIAQAVAAALAAQQHPAAAPAPAPAPVNTVSVKLPDFWVSDPDMWFFQAEAAFRSARITASRTKFDHVVMRLPEHVSVALRSFFLDVDEHDDDPYEQLKEKLVNSYSKT
jgi:hypothetical protein